MRIFFSGGSPIPESSIDHPDLMLSFFVNVKKGKPDARFKRLMKLRKKDKKEKHRASR